LESYEGKWANATEQALVGSVGQKEVLLLVNTFPQSYFQFEVPGNSTIFIDGKLWELIPKDTTFFIPTASLKRDFRKDSLFVTVINDRIQVGEVGLKVTKVAKNTQLEKEVDLEKQFLANQKRTPVQPLKDFFAVSLFLILGLAAVYRRVYPYLLGVLLQPLSVIKAEDFSESGGLQKVLASFLILLLTILKFSAIRLVSYLFELGKSEFAHFFYLLRLIAFGFALILVVSSFFVINDFYVLQSVFSHLMQGFFWVYLFGVLGLFLIMMSRLNFKKYHLFTYLCLAEIVPFLVLAKWIMVLVQ